MKRLSMKRLFYFFAILLMANGAFAQTYISMRPNWTFNTPQAENATYEYYVSKGIGNTEKAARTDAFIQAVREAQSRVGVGANSDEIFKAFQENEKGFNVVASYYEIPMKEVCNFSEQSPDGSQWYYYQLLQVAINGNTEPNFRQFTGKCYDFSEAKELQKTLGEENQKLIDAQKRAAKEKMLESYKEYNISYSEFRFRIKEFRDNPQIGYLLEKSEELTTAGVWLTYLTIFGGIGAGLGLGMGLSSEDYDPGLNCAITIPVILAICTPQIVCLSLGASYKKKAWKAYRQPYDNAVRDLHISLQISPSVGYNWAGVGMRITF